MKDHCGGTEDTNAALGKAPRNSIKLANHKEFVQKHNAARGVHHLLVMPVHAESAVSCQLCGTEDPEGWRRFSRFAKQVCPMSK